MTKGALAGNLVDVQLQRQQVHPKKKSPVTAKILKQFYNKE